MSMKGVIWAFAQHQTTSTQRLVLLAMADSAAEDRYWGGPELVMSKTGLSQASVYRATSDLKKLELVADEKDGDRPILRLRIDPPSDSQSENDISQSENPSIYGTQEEPKQQPAQTRGEADRVWDHYCSKPGKRVRPMPEQERKLILAALKVATADELIRSIDSCWASDFHMKRREHRHRDGQRYDKLSQIIKGRQGKETTRERIDFWLEREETTAVAGSGNTSADPAVIARRKQEVQRGHRLKGDPTAMRKAVEAEAWLKSIGISIKRLDDGYPTFVNDEA